MGAVQSEREWKGQVNGRDKNQSNQLIIKIQKFLNIRKNKEVLIGIYFFY